MDLIHPSKPIAKPTEVFVVRLSPELRPETTR